MNSGGTDVLMEDFNMMCEKCMCCACGSSLLYIMGTKCVCLCVCVWTNDKGQAQVRRRGFLCGETSSPLSI